MYGNIDQLKSSFGSKQDLLLQGVTDQELTEILQSQSDYIDGFLQVRYNLPLENSNPIINKICIDLSKAETYRMYASNDLPDAIKSQEKQALKDLLSIQKGNLLILPEQADEDDIVSRPTYFKEWLQ